MLREVRVRPGGAPHGQRGQRQAWVQVESVARKTQGRGPAVPGPPRAAVAVRSDSENRSPGDDSDGLDGDPPGRPEPTSRVGLGGASETGSHWHRQPEWQCHTGRRASLALPVAGSEAPGSPRRPPRKGGRRGTQGELGAGKGGGRGGRKGGRKEA